MMLAPVDTGAIAGDEALQHAESRGRRKTAGGLIAGAVGEDGEHVGLVQEDVVVHEVAQLGVNGPVRKGQGLGDSE
jgi:hypothetical protein